MNGYNLTSAFRSALEGAQAAARECRHEYVGTEHLLLSLLRGPDERVTTLLSDELGLELKWVEQELLKTVRMGRNAVVGDVPYTARAKKVLELAMTEARELRHTEVDTPHLLLGLVHEEKGIAAQVLDSFGVSLQALRRLTDRSAVDRMARRKDFIQRVAAELDRAYAKHGALQWGRHEFYGIIKEEFDEMWADIKSDAPQPQLEKEIVQVAAMCLRYFETRDRYREPA